MFHQLNMEFSNIMRDDGQKRKIVGQEDEASGHGSVALRANFPPQPPSSDASEVNDIHTIDETRICVTREEMVKWVREVNIIVLYLSEPNIDMETDLSEESWKEFAWQYTCSFRTCSTSNLAGGPS
jgi:hypothetical protein